MITATMIRQAVDNRLRPTYDWLDQGDQSSFLCNCVRKEFGFVAVQEFEQIVMDCSGSNNLSKGLPFDGRDCERGVSQQVRFMFAEFIALMLEDEGRP